MMWVVLGLMWLPWAALAAWLARQVGRGHGVNDEPEAVVRRSYAEGKIDERQFREMMANLAAGGPATTN